jgi:hypothetical protein
MIEPFSILAYVSEPAWELPQQVDEFSIQVLNAAFNLALVLGIGRMSKLSFKPVSTAPVLPSLLKL